MIVFLDIPHGAGNGLFKTFVKALGDDAVLWHGVNARFADIKDGAVDARVKILGLPVPFAAASTLPGVTLWTVLVSDPPTRMLNRWLHAERRPLDQFHAVPNTFTLREALEISHPAMASMGNMMFRHMRIPGGAAGAAGVAGIVAAMQQRPFLVGFAQHPEVYAAALDQALGLRAGTLDPAAFSETPRPLKPGELRTLIEAANTRDQSLVDALLAAAGENRVLRTVAPQMTA